MDKIISIIVGLIMLMAVSYTPVLAETTSSTSTVQELIQSLQQQITNLKSQIEVLNNQLESLRQAKGEVKDTTKGIKETLGLIRQLRIGMTGEDISLLQQILATDSEIYPEGLITGYFGPLTEKAVKKFQKVANFEQVGMVGPKTLSKVNELLKEGAGESGKVPPGLLIAPGIRQKLGFTPQPLLGQVLPPGIAKKLETPTSTLGTSTSTPDNVAPSISNLTATSTTASSTAITWISNEPANSKLWYSTLTPIVVGTSTPIISSSELTLNHSLLLTGLSTSTTYYYLVTSADAAGNTATSTEKSFITLSQ